jgi:hypothetical protein
VTNEHDAIRSQLSEEFRVDAEDLEALTEIGRLRGQTLADALGESMARGDELTIICGELSLSGTLTTVINDLAVVETATGEASVFLLGPVGFSTNPRVAGGLSGARSVRTFLAKLRELELTGEAVEVVGSFGAAAGSMAIVAKDHVRIKGAQETWLLPLTEIGIVLRPTPPFRGLD